MRYLLFSGTDYYPSGGADDLDEAYHDLDDATTAALGIKWDWWHIYDLVERKTVSEGRGTGTTTK